MNEGLGFGWVAAFAVVVLASLGYWAFSAHDCWGRGALVKNAWGGLSCIPTATP